MPDIKDFKDMMVVNSLRGAHSTGVAGVDPYKDNLVNYIKGEGSPYDVFQYDKSTEFFERAYKDFKLLIGHGRYATQGEINAQNAHPFVAGHIVLAHNGTLTNFKELKKGDYEKFEVDSELIANMISKEGAEVAIPQLHGAYALVWYNSEELTLNFARNSQRPLFMGLTKNRDNLVWSSERETIEWMEKRNRTPMKEIYEFPVMEIHSYSVDNLVPTVTKFVTKYNYYTGQNYKRNYYGAWEDDVDSYGKLFDSTPYDSGVSYEDRPPPSTNILKLPSNEYKRRKSEAKELSDKDKTTVSKVFRNVSLEVGDTITYVIDDVSDNKLITGYREDYPNIRFLSMGHNVNETILFKSKIEFVTGRVTAITPALDQDKVYNFSVSVEDIEVKERGQIDDTDMDRVIIEDTSGLDVTISSFRFKALIHLGCSYCEGKFTAHEIAHPNVLMFNEWQDEIICSACANSYNNVSTVKDASYNESRH